MARTTEALVRCSSFLAVLLLSVPEIADAQVGGVEPFDNFAPASIVYDEPPGEFDLWTKPLPCGVNRATVTIKFVKLSPNLRWKPRATVILNPSTMTNPSPEIVAASIMPSNYLSFDRPSKIFVQKIVAPSSEAIIPIPHFTYSNPMKIDMAWGHDGVVTATFADKYSASVKMEAAVSSIGLSASSAKVEFIDFKVGHAGPADDCKRN